MYTILSCSEDDRYDEYNFLYTSEFNCSHIFCDAEVVNLCTQLVPGKKWF